MAKHKHSHATTAMLVWQQFRQYHMGMAALGIVILFCLVAIYAPFLASSKPIVAVYDQDVYFPLFRYLFYTGYYTKSLDIFFNLLIFTFPLFLLILFFGKKWKWLLILSLIAMHVALFLFLNAGAVKDPASNPKLNEVRKKTAQLNISSTLDPFSINFPLTSYNPTWAFEVHYMTPYAKLNLLLRHIQMQMQHQRLQKYSHSYMEAAEEKWLSAALRREKADLISKGVPFAKLPNDSVLKAQLKKQLTTNEALEKFGIPTLWQKEQTYQLETILREQNYIRDNQKYYEKYKQWLIFFTRMCILDSVHQELGFKKISDKTTFTYNPKIAFANLGQDKTVNLYDLWRYHKILDAQWNRRALDRFLQDHTSSFSANSCILFKPWPKMQMLFGKAYNVVMAYENAKAKLSYIQERRQWLEKESQKVTFIIWPLLRTYHWEDDAGGEQSLNKFIGWWDLTRIRRKDMVAALIFGVRISLVVGISAVALALLIGIPIGAAAGFYGGKYDIVVSRLLEIWEAMPTFFMLLLVVAITQSKSIFFLITAIGVFGWTRFSRFIRGEFFKQRNLSYVDACKAQGFSNSYIIFSHILPNAIPPLLTLIPFSVMAAITSETGLSFLGLGEENSCSWGVLMDEARQVFPGESYLLWPPAILLTVFLVAIAMVGDALRDALDPKLHLFVHAPKQPEEDAQNIEEKMHVTEPTSEDKTL